MLTDTFKMKSKKKNPQRMKIDVSSSDADDKKKRKFNASNDEVSKLDMSKFIIV